MSTYNKNLVSPKKSVLWFALYFFVAASIGLFVRDIPGQPDLFATITNFMTPANVTKLGDPTYFATGALDVYHHGWIKEENKWLIRLWPPGFMVLEGMVLKLFGVDAPFIFILIILNSIFIAFFLSVFRAYLLPMMAVYFASLIPLLPLLFPVIRIFLFQPGGIILGEGFAIVFFLISMFLVPLSVRSRSWKLAVIAGLLLALSAYFRSQFQLLVMFLTLTAIFLVAGYFLILRGRVAKSERGDIAYVIRTIVIVVGIAHIAMAPWRIHNLLDPNVQSPSWVLTENLVYTNAGKTDKELNDAGGGWIVRGGGNLACKLEPTYCGKSDKGKFYLVLQNNLVNWTHHKFGIADEYWFSPLNSLRDYVFPISSPSRLDMAINLVFLFCVLLTFPLLWWTRRHRDSLIYFWECASFYSCFLAVFTLVHFETRYFYAMKIFSIFIFIALSSLAWRLYKTSDAPSVQEINKGLLHG